MPLSIDELAGHEPNMIECRTERIANNFSRCLVKNADCEHGLAAGTVNIYCMHPNRLDFEYAAFLDPPP